ncbi:hepatocyte growth factor-like [Saccostrea cucullata]|uniref:hepatocyte growth factor-like n=1 Tax=Saccostrea cuccullata TaxID=36930 RepID=UPI002ED67C81
MITFRLLIGTLFYSVTDVNAESISDDCRLPGVLYQGTKNVTETGRACQRWDTQTPHEHGYDVFSFAKENYCRNFDREEPWCFTNDTDVRWELCGVEVCATPCLNQSFYTKEIKSQCVPDIPSDGEYCSYILNLVSCLKKNVENLTGSNCSKITWRSIALQIKDTLEDLTGKSISQCILSPCRDPSVKGDSFVVITFAIPCFEEFFRDTTDGPTLCRIKQRIGHCVLSKVQDSDKTNSTCLVKDKLSMANRFLPLLPAQLQENASICVKYFYSEFPAPLENITGSKETNTEFSQTAMFVS